MALVDNWRDIEHSLPEGWKEARLSLLVHGESYARRAVELLGPANATRHGLRINLYTAPHGAGTGPKAIARLLRRLDVERIPGALELVSVTEADQSDAPRAGWLADAWDAEIEALPDDWSDLYIELTLDSSDYLEPGALAVAPLNPHRWEDTTAFRFRCARRFGYGASPEMVRRCMERLDERGITGSLRVLRALSDTKPVSTQGPVWYVGGRSV